MQKFAKIVRKLWQSAIVLLRWRRYHKTIINSNRIYFGLHSKNMFLKCNNKMLTKRQFSGNSIVTRVQCKTFSSSTTFAGVRHRPAKKKFNIFLSVLNSKMGEHKLRKVVFSLLFIPISPFQDVIYLHCVLSFDHIFKNVTYPFCWSFHPKIYLYLFTFCRSTKEKTNFSGTQTPKNLKTQTKCTQHNSLHYF